MESININSSIIFEFVFNNHKINILGTNDDPWFIANEIGEIFEMSNIHKTLSTYPKEWIKGLTFSYTLGGPQKTTTINELAVYRICMRSNKPHAIEFQNKLAEITKELRLKGVVELQKFKEEYELKHNEILRELEKSNEVIMNKTEEYNKLKSNHERILYKRTRHQLKRGKCLYITRNSNIENRYKFGITNDLNGRTSTYKTYDITDFLFICFTEDNKILEDCLKKKLSKKLVSHNSEWVTNIELDEIISSIDSIVELLDIECSKYTNMNDIVVEKVENEENINIELEEKKLDDIPEKITKSIIQIVEEDKYDETIHKKCNKCELLLTRESFNKDKSKKDGLHTTCRSCEKKCKKKYVDTKKEIMRNITEKKCSLCEIIKPVDQYIQHLHSKDGYTIYCKECINKNKKSRRELDKERNIRYKCGNCGKDYARKDVLSTHQKNCNPQ